MCQRFLNLQVQELVYQRILRPANPHQNVIRRAHHHLSRHHVLGDPRSPNHIRERRWDKQYRADIFSMVARPLLRAGSRGSLQDNAEHPAHERMRPQPR